MGVDLFNLPKENLKEAKEILLRFRGVGQAESLLKIIKELENR